MDYVQLIHAINSYCLSVHFCEISKNSVRFFSVCISRVKPSFRSLNLLILKQKYITREIYVHTGNPYFFATLYIVL